MKYKTIKEILFLIASRYSSRTKSYREYFEQSVKSTTRSDRTDLTPGIRYSVKAGTPLPPDWDDFLSNSDSKKELNEFIAEEIINRIKISSGKILITTVNENILRLPFESTATYQSLQPCNHEEADTVLHECFFML